MKIKIIVLVLSAIFFLISTLLVTSGNTFIINLNNTVKTFIENNQSPFVFNFFSVITKIGDVLGASIIIIIIGLFLASKNIKFFEIFVIAAALGALLPFVIKLLTRIPRPSIFPTDFSFPSGHAAIATVFLFSFIFLLIPLVKNGVLKNVSLITALILFPLVAFSRIYLSVHWTSDVIAGIFLGITCFMSAAILLL